MSTTTSETLAAIEESQKEQLTRALERGGLPTETEGEKLNADLYDVLAKFEAITWRVEGIALSDDGRDLPFRISLEQLGVLAVLADDIERKTAELTDFGARVRNAISSLAAVACEQKLRAKREGS